MTPLPGIAILLSVMSSFWTNPTRATRELASLEADALDLSPSESSEITQALQPATMKTLAKRWRKQALHKGKARQGSKLCWMWQLWTKKTKVSVPKKVMRPNGTEGTIMVTEERPNDLEPVLGDGINVPLLEVTPQRNSGLRELMTFFPENQPPPHMRFMLYKPIRSRNGSSPVKLERFCCTKDGNPNPVNCPNPRVNKPGCGIKPDKSWALSDTLEKLDQKRTIVIGNGGFGGSGGVEFLALQYNKYLKGESKKCISCVRESKTSGEVASGCKRYNPVLGCGKYKPVNVIWRAGDSNHNMGAIDKVDLAITYEPVLEQRLKDNNMVAKVLPLFVNYFAFVIPRTDPLGVVDFFYGGGKQDPDPFVVLMFIILKGFFEVMAGKGRTYASRWNWSAMGLRDHITMMASTKELAQMVCGGSSGSTDPDSPRSRLYAEVLSPMRKQFMGWLAARVGSLPGDKQGTRVPALCAVTKNGGDELYLAWHRHCVFPHRLKFPWDIRDEAMKANQYHMNDMAFLDPNVFVEIDKARGLCVAPSAPASVKGCWYQMASNRADIELNPLANPAQLLLPTRSAPGGAAWRFFEWAEANNAKSNFWAGFSQYPRAVDTVSQRYKDFSVVHAATKALQEKGENPSDAVESRANLYYWAHSNVADTHEVSLQLKLACNHTGLSDGLTCKWPQWNVFAHYAVETATSTESLSEFLIRESKCSQIPTKNNGIARVESLVQVIDEYTRQITFSDRVDSREIIDQSCSPCCVARRNLVEALHDGIEIDIKVGGDAPSKRWIYTGRKVGSSE
jgi:hypothetical protein